MACAKDVLPSTHFSTDAFDESLRFEAWRQFLPLYTVLPHPDEPVPAFSGAVSARWLGPIGMGVASFSPQRYVRNRERIAEDGHDHLIIQLMTSGGLHATLPSGDEVAVGAGDIWVHDLARPKCVTTRSSRTLSLLLPRDDMLRMMGAVELDTSVLRRGTPLGSLLAQYLRMLTRTAGTMAGDEAPAAAQGTMALTAACLRPGARTFDLARGPLATLLLERLKHYIGAHLASPDLTPDSLCETFRISRSHLYRLFAPLGGVAGYIWQCRLERAAHQLRDPANARRTVADIAFDCGFVSEAHFSRAFRKVFGMPPREVRGAGLGFVLDDTILRQIEAAPGRR